MILIYKKYTLRLTGALIILSVAIGISSPTINNKVLASSPLPSTTEDTVSIGFVGDIAPGINASDDIFSEVIPYTQKPDIMIGNFEGVVAKNKYTKCKAASKYCFTFNGDNKFLKLLSLASFDVLNVANNHFNDYGQKGQEETLKNIQEAGIVASGIKDKVTYLTKNNIVLGIVGFGTNPWSTNLNNIEDVKKIIKEADQNADIVVVVFHGGGEGEKYTHVPIGMEKYIGERRGDLRFFTHSAVDAGADIVFGSGPHVLRGIEKYKNKIIAYSLGNFASANKLSTAGLKKTTAMIETTLLKDGSLVSGKIIPFEINSQKKITQPDLKNTAITMMNNLSKTDFNLSATVLNSLGEIQIK